MFCSNQTCLKHIGFVSEADRVYSTEKGYVVGKRCPFCGVYTQRYYPKTSKTMRNFDEKAPNFKGDWYKAKACTKQAQTQEESHPQEKDPEENLEGKVLVQEVYVAFQL